MLDSTNDGSDFDALFSSASKAEESRLADSYFAEDCLWIVEHAQRSANYLPGIAALVLCSIQQPFNQMRTQLADVAKRGDASKWLFLHKRAGFSYVRAFKRDLWRSAKRCYAGEITLDDLILDYLAIPSLGIVKASFLAQMTVGRGACMDTNNLTRLGLSERAFRTDKGLKVESIRKRIATYNATWLAHGDSCYWWDSWCDFVGDRTQNVRGAKLAGFAGGGAEVSRLHRLAITGGIT